MRLMHFQFTIGHVPGKDPTITDTLSRAPSSTPSADDEFLQQEHFVCGLHDETTARHRAASCRGQ